MSTTTFLLQFESIIVDPCSRRMHHGVWQWMILVASAPLSAKAFHASKAQTWPVRLAVGRNVEPPLVATPCHSSTKNDCAGDAGQEPSGKRLLLRLSYDGRRFKGGWEDDCSTTSHHQGQRSVKAVVQKNLAKLYGNISPTRIIVKACVPSSLDPGVHAVGLVVQVFGLKEEENNNARRSLEPEDSVRSNLDLLLPLPMSPHDICFALNRLCDDVQVKAYTHPTDDGEFHLSVRSVTYLYRLSIGPRPDPIHRHQVWQNNNVTIIDDPLTTLGRMQAACHRMVILGAAENDMLDGMLVSRHEPDWHGTWRYDVTITGRLTDRMVRSHVAKVVAAVDSNMSTLSAAPAHGLVLVNVQYDQDLTWHSANWSVKYTCVCC